MVKNWTKGCLLMLAFGMVMHAFAYDSSCNAQPCFNIPSASGKWFVDGEFLWWEAKEDGLDYIRYYVAEVTPSTVKNSAPHQKCNPGFRIGLGYKGDCDQWFSSFTWTHYQNRSRGALDKTATQDVYSFESRYLISGTLVGLAQSLIANADWKLNYDILDLETGMSYCMHRRFSVTPFVGLRAVFLSQQFNNDITSTFQEFTTTRFERAHSKFQAGGFRGGFDAVWQLGCGLGVYGKASASLVYGRFKITDDVFTNSLTASDFKYHFDRVRANLEGAIGLQWASCFCNNTRRIALRVGYELVEWFDQNQFPGAIQTESTRSSNLSFQGLQVTACLDF